MLCSLYTILSCDRDTIERCWIVRYGPAMSKVRKQWGAPRWAACTYIYIYIYIYSGDISTRRRLWWTNHSCQLDSDPQGFDWCAWPITCERIQSYERIESYVLAKFIIRTISSILVILSFLILHMHHMAQFHTWIAAIYTINGHMPSKSGAFRNRQKKLVGLKPQTKANSVMRACSGRHAPELRDVRQTYSDCSTCHL